MYPLCSHVEKTVQETAGISVSSDRVGNKRLVDVAFVKMFVLCCHRRFDVTVQPAKTHLPGGKKTRRRDLSAH